jgi:hypothetical protein
MELHALILGVDNFSTLLQVRDYFEQAHGPVSMDARFIVLEGEEPTVQQVAAIRRVQPDGCVHLPDANTDDVAWAKRFERGKFWVRRHLGDRALIGWKNMDRLASLLPTLPGEGGMHTPETQARAALFTRLANLIRDGAAPEEAPCYVPPTAVTDPRTEAMKALIKDFESAGDSERIIADLLNYLGNQPVLGRPFDLNDAGVAFGVRPSEFILHREPGYRLTPPSWERLDWTVLAVGNRNAEDILSRCLFASAAKSPVHELPAIADVARSIVILQWPNPQADRPISGSAWPQLAAQRFARKLQSRQQGRPWLSAEARERLPAALVHFSEPLRTAMSAGKPPERVAEMADYLELFAYWQQHEATNARSGQPPAWQETCFAADGQGRSVVLGLARAIVEVPGAVMRLFGTRRTPFRIYATMESGTRWQWKDEDRSAKPELLIEVGSWSLDPRLWADELKSATGGMKVHAQLFGGKVSEALRRFGNGLQVRWHCGEAGPAAAGGGGVVDTSRIISVPYDNFLGLLIVVTLPNAVPVKFDHSYE